MDNHEEERSLNANDGVDQIKLLMECGAAKLTLLGIDDLYAIRTEQLIKFVEKIQNINKGSNERNSSGSECWYAARALVAEPAITSLQDANNLTKNESSH